jgi:hypothetical protein
VAELINRSGLAKKNMLWTIGCTRLEFPTNFAGQVSKFLLSIFIFLPLESVCERLRDIEAVVGIKLSPKDAPQQL